MCRQNGWAGEVAQETVLWFRLQFQFLSEFSHPYAVCLCTKLFLRRDSPKLQGNKACLLSCFKALGAAVIQVNGCGVALAYRNSLLKQSAHRLLSHPHSIGLGLFVPPSSPLMQTWRTSPYHCHHHLGLPNPFHHERLVQLLPVLSSAQPSCDRVVWFLVCNVGFPPCTFACSRFTTL